MTTRARTTRAIRIAAPGDIGARQIGIALPTLFVNQRLQAGAIGAGHGTEYPKTGLFGGVVGIHALGFECLDFGAVALGCRVDSIGLINGGDGTRR